MKLTKIYTYWDTFNGALSEPMLRFSVTDFVAEGGFGHQEHDIDLDVAEPSKADAVQSIVTGLRAKQAEHRASIALLDDRISSLLCLEHKEVPQ